MITKATINGKRMPKDENTKNIVLTSKVQESYLQNENMYINSLKLGLS